MHTITIIFTPLDPGLAGCCFLYTVCPSKRCFCVWFFALSVLFSEAGPHTSVWFHIVCVWGKPTLLLDEAQLRNTVASVVTASLENSSIVLVAGKTEFSLEDHCKGRTDFGTKRSSCKYIVNLLMPMILLVLSK